jgi:hypothetical protein
MTAEAADSVSVADEIDTVAELAAGKPLLCGDVMG